MSWIYLVKGHSFENLQIGKSLGKGMEGEVFQASVGKKLYALKRERIAKQSKPLEYELEFVTKFANKQPGFMHLYAYRILKDETWQLDQSKRKTERDIKFLAAKAKLPYVVEKVYTYLAPISDKSMHPVDFVRQLMPLIRQMRKAGWAHRDTHGNNVILTSKGPVIVDYSLVIHKSHVSDKIWKKTCNDYNFLPDYLAYSRLWKYIRSKQLEVPPYQQWIKHLKGHKEEWELTIELLQCSDPTDNIIGYIGALYWEQLHQDFVLGRKLKLMPTDLYLDIELLGPFACAAHQADYKRMNSILLKA